ncbi:MAG: DMT family transporter [Microcystaceae cyanobacterium]
MELKFNPQNLAKSPFILVAPFFFLGTAMVVMKFIIPDTTPLFLAAFRLIPAGILVVLLAALFNIPQPKGWKAWLWILLFAVVDGAMFQGFLTTGLVNTGAGLGAVLIDAQPLVVALLANWIFSDKIGLWGWLGLIIGLIGICFCGLPSEWISSLLAGQGIPVSPSSFTLDNIVQSGELLMVFAALSMSFGTIIIRVVKKYTDPVIATGWHMFLGGIPLLILSFLWESNQWQNITPQGWLGMGYATVFGTAVTYGLFFFLAANGNLTSVSALIFLTPVFALLFSNIFLKEQLTQFQWIGVSLTLVSVYLVNQRAEIEKRLTSGFIGLTTLDSDKSESETPT